MPEETLSRILELAQRSYPTEMLEMSSRPNSSLGFSLPRAWRSPGDLARDPIRRTSLALVDDADRLLHVSRAKRRQCLDRMEAFGGAEEHRVVNVYIGSAELADAISDCGATQVVTFRPMPCDETFTTVAGMVFGPVAEDDARRLHDATGGRMGPLLHLAALRGLRPPYAVPDSAILRLNGPGPGRVEDV